MSGPTDEFDWIASLRPLTRGEPAALGLMDDAAVLPGRPGFDLVISKDAQVEGVHFVVGEAADVVARRLLRTSVSDLAAKAAEPFGYFLLTAWPANRGAADRDAFRRGLAEDGERFGLALLGGDTVSTPGPLTVSATVLGWVPEGRAVLRSGAMPGDALVVCGGFGHGFLGWKSARGEIDDPHGTFAAHYALPAPLLGLREVLRAHAHAAADVSDGLLADALHIARASGLRLTLDLDQAPMGDDVKAWLHGQSDREAAVLALAAGGDDYAIVCAVAPEETDRLVAEARREGVAAARIGRFEAGTGLAVTLGGRKITPDGLGWRHG